LTWTDLDDRVSRLSGALAERGVVPGTRVLWLGQNCHRVLELLLACAQLGAVFCPANWRQSSGEFAFVIDDVDPTIVVWQDEEIGDAVREARAIATRASNARWLQHDAGEYEAVVAGASPRPSAPVDPGAAVLLLYTAAFDGSPNGALLTHAGIIAQNLVFMAVHQVT
jgi:long-chain acyl-CoA synthetase